jgi:hypothetical protein
VKSQQCISRTHAATFQLECPNRCGNVAWGMCDVGWTMHRCMGLACAFLTFPNLCTIWTLVSVPKRTTFSTSRSSSRMHLISYSPLQTGKEGHTIWGSQNPQQRGARRATSATPAARRNITVDIGGCLLPSTKCGWTVSGYITSSKGP